MTARSRGVPPWLTRNLVILTLVSFTQDAASELMYPLLPILLTGVLAAPPVVLGVVEEMAVYHAGGARPTLSAAEVARHAETYAADLLALRNAFIQRHQNTMIKALVASGNLVAA